MRKFLFSTTLVTIAVGAACSSQGAALHLDDFQSGTTAGWGGGAAPTLQFSGGPTGSGDAFLRITSSAPIGPGSKLATHNDSPDWIGDYAALDASRVTVDLRNPATSPPLSMRLVLLGPVTTGERYTSTNAQTVPNDGGWHHYEFSLAESDLSQVLGNATHADLMQNVLRVMLRHDSGSPSSGGTPVFATLDLDNIRLATIRSAADFNDDGLVDGVDLSIWSSSFATSAMADADGDGDTDGADWLLWQRHDTGPSNTTGLVRVVPEPAASYLLALALVWCSTLARICQDRSRSQTGSRVLRT